MATKRFILDGAPLPPINLRDVKLLYASYAKYSADWESIPHSHGCIELFYIVSGSGQFQIGELSLPVSAADLVVVNSNVDHTEFSHDQNPLEYIVLGFEGLEYSPGEEQDKDNRYLLTHVQEGQDFVLRDLRDILRELEEKRPGYNVICQNLLVSLIIRLSRRNDASFLPASGRRPNRECSIVRRYIDGHFKENITLDQLAALVHVNKYYMSHSFSREYGVSPINYLISRRIEESKYLLTDTNHTLSQISHMLGFSSPSYFSQSFRRLVGTKPLAYRKAAHVPGEGGEAEPDKVSTGKGALSARGKKTGK